MMYQEIAPLYEGHCPDLHESSLEQSSFESEESVLAQSLYSFEPSNSEPVFGNSYSFEDDTFPNRENIDANEDFTQAPNAADNFQNSLLDRKVLPEILNCFDMQWITSSSTDVRIQSPVNTSPKSSTAPAHPYQSLSSPAEPTRTKNIAKPDSVDRNPCQPTNQVESTKTSTPQAKPISKPISSKPKGTPGRKRKYQDHELSPAEAARRHIRRERNKLAAAKCRNRRRELTDRLQGETDHLEDHQQMLQREIVALEREKKNLEYILASHSPNCKAGMLTDLKVFQQQYTDLVRQEGAIDLSTISSYQSTENTVITENNDNALPYLRKHSDEMRLSDSFSTPFNNLPVSIPHPFHFRNHDSIYNSMLERQRNCLRRQTAFDVTPSVPPATSFDQNVNSSHPLQKYQDNVSSKRNNCSQFFPVSENRRPKQSLPFQRPPTNDSEYNSMLTNSSFMTSFSSSPISLMGKSTQQVCSFNHRQHSETNSRPSPNSVKSPKHLLAL